MDQQERNKKIARAKKRRKQALMIRVIVFIILIVSVVVGGILIKKFGPSKEKVDLNKYFGIQHENQLAVTVDNEVIGAKGMLIDGEPYVEYAVVRDHVNGRFYVDVNENILLYTLPDGTIRAGVGSKDYTYQKETESKDYVIFKMEGSVAYISLRFVQEYTDMEYQVYEEPDRVMITADSGEFETAVVKKTTQLRDKGNVKGSIISKLSKKLQVTIIEEEGKWSKVRTEDGFVGYMKTKCLKDRKTVNVERQDKQNYKNISKNYTINLAWHSVADGSADSGVLEKIANSKGLTTISPTWFTVANTEGKITSLASTQYVNYAHQSNIEVWAMVNDYDGGIDSYEETYELLSHTTYRETMVNRLVSEVLRTDADGINVNFERVSKECAEHYMQFLRELSLKCRQNGIILSVDNYVMRDELAPYYLKEQGKVADYVVVMGYNEHGQDSRESGPISSLGYVEKGIEKMLKYVPEEKVISAIPFFTRLWMETKITEEETEVTNQVYGMIGSKNVIEQAGAKIEKDKASGQNFATWEIDGVTHKIWLEDEASVEAKLALMKKYNLAGNAVWRLGYENSGVWELILKYVN